MAESDKTLDLGDQVELGRLEAGSLTILLPSTSLLSVPCWFWQRYLEGVPGLFYPIYWLLIFTVIVGFGSHSVCGVSLGCCIYQHPATYIT